MSVARFAGPALKALKGILVPRTAAGGVAYGQLAARYAPDVLYSGLSAAMLPEGATTGERLGVAAEDLGIGLLGSLAGQTMGGGAARLAGKRLSNEGRDLVATMGDLMVGAPVSVWAPTPVWDSAINRITEEQYKKQQQQEAAQAQANQEMSEAQAQQELISLLLGAGAVSGRALS